MKRYLFILFIGLSVISCKSEFEKIRTSNDPVTIYEKGLEYYRIGEYAKAQSLFEIVIPFYRGRAEAEELFYKYAYTHYYIREYILAAHYFASFERTFYNSDKREEAAFMTAYSNLQMSPNHRLDQSHSNKAIEEFQNFMNKYPKSSRVSECNAVIDELRAKLELKAFEQGQLYYELKNYNSAITAFENMLKDYPESKRAEEIRYIMLKSSFEWAENSIYTRKPERFNETIKRYEQFIKKYPKSKYSKEALGIKKNSENALKSLTNV